jgi:hypothetical protein
MGISCLEEISPIVGYSGAAVNGTLCEQRRKLDCYGFVKRPAALSEPPWAFSTAGRNLCIAVSIMGKSILRQFVLAAVALAIPVAAQISEVPAQGPIRIISPKPGEVSHQDFVVVRYQLLQQPTSASSASFQVQIDAADPVLTNELQQGFRGLQPGRHTVQVQAVDANGTPVAGSRAEVQFTVAPRRSSLLVPEAYGAETGSPQPDTAGETSADPQHISVGSSALPILSAVGLGALVGGIISALRTRN